MRYVRALAALSVVVVCWVAFEFAQPPETMVKGAQVFAEFQAGGEEPRPWELRFGNHGQVRPGRSYPRSRPVETTAPPAATTTAPAGPPPTSTTSTTVRTTSTTVGTTSTTVAPPTTTAPPPSSTTTTAPVGAIVVNPGNNLASLVGSNPAGTAFWIKAGTHVGQSVAPKDGNQFIGEPGAILDGNKAQFAFAGVAANVVIQGLVIEDYTNAPQLGAIHGSGSGWLVLDNEIRYNGTAGVVVPAGSLVSGNNIHHNGQIGLKAVGANVVIDGNEIAYNNYLDAFDMNWEAGGTKFLDTANLIVRNNYVHDNHGAGLWTDYNNHGTLYEANVTINNYGPGIFHEISGAAVIRNNRVEGNGHRWYLGGILVANSTGVEVANNTLTGNNGGVMALNQVRDSWVTKNLWVHDNVASYTTGQTGIFAEANGDVIYGAWGNRFDANSYVAVSGSAPFRWVGDVAWDAWRAAGMDVSGSFS